jgi:hypothetical protein
MLYAVLFSFMIASRDGGTLTGHAADDTHFRTMAACEAARTAAVDRFVLVMRHIHGATEFRLTESHCGFAAELGSEPV